MPELLVTTLEGAARSVSGGGGRSVMEVIRDHGFDELQALCGGSLSCATCHVYVDPGFLPQLPPMQKDEDELLESSAFRRPESRLSCQLPFGAALDGLRVTIAPGD